jgi:hypothetical protein
MIENQLSYRDPNTKLNPIIEDIKRYRDYTGKDKHSRDDRLPQRRLFITPTVKIVCPMEIE